MKTSLTFGKTIQEDIFGNKTRYLDCTITVKGNNAESTMWKMVEIMNRELKEYGFEFNDGYGVEESQAYNTMAILFETGYMTEYKEAVKEAYRVAKAEIKENKEVKAEVKEVQTEVHNIEATTLEEVSAEQEYLLKIMTENNFTLEYGQQSLLDEVLEKCDDYYFNGVSSYKIGYYWYTITLNGVEYDLYSKNK